MNRFTISTRLSMLTCVLALLFAGIASAQGNRAAREKALQFLQGNYAQFNLTQPDVADTRVTDEYKSKNNNVTHVWVQQQHLGIPVFNALFGLHVAADGKVYTVGHRFVKDLAHKVNTQMPSLAASTALEMALANLGFTAQDMPSLKTRINDRNWVFEKGAVSRKDIPVSACYVDRNDGTVRLAWTMVIDQANNSDVWMICVDAQTGLILEKINHTVYCAPESLAHADAGCEEPNGVSMPSVPQAPQSFLLADETYNVFALPVESPLHGSRQVLVNPADLMASPYGWLDTNGVAGAEFTYTKGNNAWAFDDSANDNKGSEAESASGGAGLNFDFPFDGNAEPAANRLTAIANLFYMANKMHDITYRFGFDEEAGNFQINNYGKGGTEGDPVSAQAFDGSGTNNANFSTPPDGESGRMQMYLWNTGSERVVKVNAPGVAIGTYFGGSGGWGGAITSTPLTADVVFINDGAEPTVGCEPANNDLNGKIVMIDRGECEFGLKALLAEQAGAVGCIICDHEAPPKTGFGAGAYGGQVSIPSIYMKKADCALLRQFAGVGLNISLVKPTITGPANLDGDLDNGIIAHEYGHGISNRLTGGPSNTGCLGNAEQMGEGWSDFFSLATTVRPGDVATTKRGVGNYVLRKDIDGTGIRRYPYTTDMSVNPITYSTVALNPEVHALGEIWTAMLWDMYWAFVEKYGYDADINNANSGNARAVQLVMDGMKMQPCYPGFVDGRDAILLADKINYGGADTCLISTVFARRGLGYLADQKNTDSGVDGIENFDPLPKCVKELKIKKVTTTPLVNPGENAEFALTVTNHKGVAVNDVVVNDEIPAGASFVSASNGGSVSGNSIVWHLGNMADGQVINLTYTLKAAPNAGSNSYFYDPMDTEDNWYSLSVNADNPEFFTLQSGDVHNDQAAWLANESGSLKTDFVLETFQEITITGSKPILRFWHKYETEGGSDPGFLEFRDVNEDPSIWRRVSKDVTFRNGYPGRVIYGGAYAFPNHYGFSGSSGGWIQSYFDMSQYTGKTITFRFRFGTDAADAPANGRWVVDQVEIMDMSNFDTEACVSSGSGDHACDRAEERGVILEPGTVGTKEPDADNLPVLVQPNPAHDVVSIHVPEKMEGTVSITLRNADGREVLSQRMNGLSAGQVVPLNVSNLPAGFYMLQLESAGFKGNAKVVVK